MKNRSLGWGILGTGAIARSFAEALTESRTGELRAIASRDRERAARLAADMGGVGAHGAYADLLADDGIDVVYVALPNNLHAEWAVAAARAGKHVLCEKPLGMDAAEVAAMIAAAREHDVFLMEGLMYRCHPQTAKLLELIRAGAVGEPHLIQATFSFLTRSRPTARLLNPVLGGGGILDVGCYCASMARLLAGAATGQPFAEPVRVRACGVQGAATGVDELAVAAVEFPGGILAQLAAGVRLPMENNVRIWGGDGSIVVPSPWLGSRTAGFSKIIVFRDGVPDEVVVEADRNIYAYEADHVAAHLAARESPAVPWADSAGNARLLDRWLAELAGEQPPTAPA